MTLYEDWDWPLRGTGPTRKCIKGVIANGGQGPSRFLIADQRAGTNCIYPFGWKQKMAGRRVIDFQFFQDIISLHKVLNRIQFFLV